MKGRHERTFYIIIKSIIFQLVLYLAFLLVFYGLSNGLYTTNYLRPSFQEFLKLVTIDAWYDPLFNPNSGFTNYLIFNVENFVITSCEIIFPLIIGKIWYGWFKKKNTKILPTSRGRWFFIYTGIIVPILGIFLANLIWKDSILLSLGMIIGFSIGIRYLLEIFGKKPLSSEHGPSLSPVFRATVEFSLLFFYILLTLVVAHRESFHWIYLGRYRSNVYSVYWVFVYLVLHTYWIWVIGNLVNLIWIWTRHPNLFIVKRISREIALIQWMIFLMVFIVIWMFLISGIISRMRLVGFFV